MSVYVSEILVSQDRFDVCPLQVEACSLAQETSTEVQHPLLDKVKQCSTCPQQAALFFQQILNPAPHVRRQAIRHAWCAKSISRMCRATRTPIPPDDASTDFFWQLDDSCLVSSCAAFIECFSCTGSPKVRQKSQPCCNGGQHEPFQHTRQRLSKLFGRDQEVKPEHASRSRSGRKAPLSCIKSALSRKRKLVSTDTASDSVKMSPTDLPQSAPIADSNADKHAALRSEKQPVQFKDVHANEAGPVPAAVVGLTAVSARALMQDQPAVHELAAQAAEHHQPEHCSTEGFEMPASQQVPLSQAQNAATAELCTDSPPAVDSDRYRCPLSCVPCTVGHASACCRPLL